MDRISSLGAIVARILVALVFLLNGFGVIDQSIPARQLMERGVPASLVSLVMFFGRALELAAGTALALAGATAGASMLNCSVAAPLFVCGLMTAICALARVYLLPNRSY
jgi:uncharacterized membrane protein YphA (DoxX/SURF4 family)